MKKVLVKFILALAIIFCISIVFEKNKNVVVEFPVAKAEIIGITPYCVGPIHTCVSDLDSVWKDVQNNCSDMDDIDDSIEIIVEDC